MKNFTFLWVAILGFATAMQGQRITDLHTFSMMPAGLSDAEATAADEIDPLSSGFTIHQTGSAGINFSGHTYIFYAIA